jgi:hypothetical protein
MRTKYKSMCSSYDKLLKYMENLMRNLDWYLEQIQKNESIFPVDSYHTGMPMQKRIKPTYVDEEGDIVERKKLLVDFDGTIHKYSKGWADGTIYDEPIDGAGRAINILKDKYEIIIFSTRASCKEQGGNCINQIKNMKQWLDRYGIHYDDITSEKIGAFRMIDDLAIPFKGNWNDVLQEINTAEEE